MKNSEENIKKNFRVPTDYFQKLEEEVISKTVEASPIQAKTRRLWQPWMTIAASIVLLAVVSFGWMQFGNSNTFADHVTAETDYLAGVEDELFAALLSEETTKDATLIDLANFLTELEEFENYYNNNFQINLNSK